MLRVLGVWPHPHIWKPQSRFFYSLSNFCWATTTITGSLQFNIINTGRAKLRIWIYGRDSALHSGRTYRDVITSTNCSNRGRIDKRRRVKFHESEATQLTCDVVHHNVLSHNCDSVDGGPFVGWLVNTVGLSRGKMAGGIRCHLVWRLIRAEVILR